MLIRRELLSKCYLLASCGNLPHNCKVPRLQRMWVQPGGDPTSAHDWCQCPWETAPTSLACDYPPMVQGQQASLQLNVDICDWNVACHNDPFFARHLNVVLLQVVNIFAHIVVGKDEECLHTTSSSSGSLAGFQRSRAVWLGRPDC